MANCTKHSRQTYVRQRSREIQESYGGNVEDEEVGCEEIGGGLKKL